MSASIRFAVSVPANGTIANALAGSPFEFAPNAQAVSIALTVPAGIALGAVVADINFGPDLKMQSGPIAAEVAAGQGPRIPDNVVVKSIAAPGDRLTVQLRNTTAGALVVAGQVFTED